MREISLVLGTAGHVDHGKTALINALTGINCDRLIEEKKRGMTIELGFAQLIIDDEKIVSVIDVPGHEKFIRQMVAGASGIDAALLVIAADEGIMPQTHEHLAIMELLGVHDGLISLTKIDKLKDEKEMLKLVIDDVKKFVQGTFLENKPIIPVSSITGENLDELRTEIKNLIERVKIRSCSGPFFLPVDRTFVISGFGTVVTGTAYHGTINLGDKISVLPSGREARVRTLQVHNKNVKSAYAGQRVAANLAGIDIDEISRGDVICHKEIFKTTKCFECVIKILPSVKESLIHWQRVHVYIGTSEVLARVSLLNSKHIDPGQESPAQLVLEEPVACTYGQRFIIRFYSPLITIGGGEIIFPYSYKPRGATGRTKILKRIENLHNADEIKRFEYLINESGKINKSDAPLLLQATRENIDTLANKLLSQEKIVELDNNYISKDFAQKLKSATLTSNFIPENDEIFNANKALVKKICTERKWHLITINELKAEINLPEKIFTNLIRAMKNSGELALIPEGYVLIKELEDEIKVLLRNLGNKITLAQVRDSTKSTRKFILPVLEYFDSKGYTRRVGDYRVVL